MLKFKIRNTALKLLEHVYSHINVSFHVENLECKSLISEDISISDITLASKYLLDKHYISQSRKELASETISCDITVEGVDWVEDCNNISHRNQ